MAVNASTRPLAGAAAAFTAGVALAAWVEPQPQVPLWASGGLLLAAAISLNLDRERIAAWALLLAAAALGLQHRCLAEARYPGPQILARSASAAEGLPTELVGVLLRDPETGRNGWKLLLDLELLQGQPARGQVSLWLPPGRTPPWRAGTRIRVGARIMPPRRYGNPGSPDFAAILRSQGLAATGSIKSLLLVETLGPAPGRELARLGAWIRRALLGGLERSFQTYGPEMEPRRALLAALLVGVRGGMDPEDDTTLRRAGLFHLVAISGLHFTLILGAAWIALRLVGWSRRNCCLLVAPICGLYALAAGGRSSVGRAALMSLLILAGRYLSVRLDPLNSIALAALALLIGDPLQLDDPGFQLTFVATLALLRLYPPLRPWLPQRPKWLWNGLGISAAAFAGVQPLIAAAFERCSPISLLLNLAAVPVFGLITLLGLFASATSLVAPLGRWAAGAAIYLMDGALALSNRATELPGAASRVAPPAPLMLLAIYAALAISCSARRQGFRRGAGTVALALLLQISLPPARGPGDGLLHLCAVDVGQGDSLIAILPHGAALLVDGGGQRNSGLDVGDAVLGPLLARLAVRRLEVVALSHAHADHLQGLFAIARDFPIDRVWQAESPRHDPGFSNFSALLLRRGIALLSVTRGYRERIDGVEVEVLHPQRGASDPTRVRNNDSQVLRLSYGRTTFLLTGDIESGAELELVARGDAAATVLKIPHHGSRTSSSATFLSAVRPSWAILSLAERNPFGFPQPEVVDRYRQLGVRLLRTDRHGMISLVSDGVRISASSFYAVSMQP
jgi:competence protein ComEC